MAAGAAISNLPANSIEAKILTVWQAVIGVPRIGLHDRLFSLGTDSLQVFRIAAQLDKEGIAVSARDLMKNPTIAILAQGLEESTPASTGAPAPKGPSLADFRRGARRRTPSS